ncbi:MAG TPA: hypothetical protein P5236_01105 [Paludibacteraceae bacterium]|nr:hypothetical protein [Paludibacteraceae bacterium]HOL00126.1 hypothetical protein [Paludibacteraceae bacterium]HPO67050.1 hypothetical protein [Paludibacteraceae bacterium]HRU62993.1 hypothetical protein [Paludibacteraceae bacterium]
MKKLVLLFAVVFAFVACGKKATQESTETDTTSVVAPVDTIVESIDTTTVDTTVAPM